MFNLYFAGSDNPAWREYLIKKKANRLASWINDRNVINGWIENKAKGNLFIDSGAFSAHTVGKEVDVDQYINFLNAKEEEMLNKIQELQNSKHQILAKVI